MEAKISVKSCQALLHDADAELRCTGLKAVDALVDGHWHELADSLCAIEALREDATFKYHQLASLVTSKLYFHLEEYGEALNCALAAGPYFDATETSAYTKAMIGRCIDEYKSHARAKLQLEEWGEQPQVQTALDPRLVEIVEGLIKRCSEQGMGGVAVSVAMEVYQLDLMDWIFAKEADCRVLCQQIMSVLPNFALLPKFKKELLKLLVKHMKRCQEEHAAAPDWPSHVSGIQTLWRAYYELRSKEGMTEVLTHALDQHGSRGKLLSFQLCFDLLQNDDAWFNAELCSCLKKALQLRDETSEAAKCLEPITRILNGKAAMELTAFFLQKRNQATVSVIDGIRNSVESRASAFHLSVILAHAFMQAGTANDSWLRANIDWVARASNWAKFSASATLGIVHMGNTSNSKHVLAAYLPARGASSNAFADGGAYYALGLIHANRWDSETEEYLLEKLKSAHDSEPHVHGAALALGLVSFMHHQPHVYKALRDTLFSTCVVGAEGAAIGIGLMNLGSANDQILEELHQYALENPHEKVVRGCALGIALCCYRAGFKAVPFIASLLDASEPFIRYGGAFAVGTAFCGTSAVWAIKQLLKLTISDVSDDVRRAAATAFGFVMCDTPDQLIQILLLLKTSYNAHVRYGAALAAGIGLAASAHPEAVAFLLSLTVDKVEFVQNAAFIGLALVFQQTAHPNLPADPVFSFKQKLKTTIAKKHYDLVARFGAVIASGIIDAAGRNARSTLWKTPRAPSPLAAAGFLLFAQTWYWFPYSHFLSLTFHPSMLVGVDEHLRAPLAALVECDRLADFAYANSVAADQPARKPAVHATLSAAARKGTDKAKKKSPPPALETQKPDHPPDRVVLPTLENPIRVTNAQEKHIKWKSDSRYAPLCPRSSGFVLLADSRPEEPAEYARVQLEPKTSADAERPCPKPFSWTG